MDEIKVLDTYALCELHKGNPKFKHYINSNILVPDLTLVEFYDVIFRFYDEKTANIWFEKFIIYSVPVQISILIKAVKFRRSNPKRNLSFFDAVGYTFAKENNYTFVTGDKEFEHFPNVEFIKK